MSSTPFLLIGNSGMLGTTFERLMNHNALPYTALDFPAFDLTRPDHVNSAITPPDAASTIASHISLLSSPSARMYTRIRVMSSVDLAARWVERARRVGLGRGRIRTAATGL